MLFEKENIINQKVPFVGKYVILDIETANSHDDPCQIGGIICENGIVTKTVCELCKPQNDFADMNIRMHKITPEMVKDKPSFRTVWEQNFSFIDTNTFVVGHYVSGVLNEITDCLHKLGLDICSLNYIDTLAIAQRCFSKDYIESMIKLETKYGRPIGHYRLKTLAKLLDLPIPNHNASDDCITELNLFSYLYENYRDKIELGRGRSFTYIGESPQLLQKQEENRILFRQLSKEVNEFLDVLINCVPDIDGEIYGEPALELKDWSINHSSLINRISPALFQKINSVIANGKMSEEEYDEISKQAYNFLNSEKKRLSI